VKFSILNIKSLSGSKAQIYSIKYEEKYASELKIFIDKFNDSHTEIVNEAIQRIQLIAQKEGVQDSFFRRECPKSHNVFRLLETKELRLYCIKLDSTILLFGYSGTKKFNKIKLKDNPSLQQEVKTLQKIEDAIKERIKKGELSITPEGLKGNLENLEI